jgi:tRNA threonylcarbamoyladenosine biosynthesis protein TsaB
MPILGIETSTPAGSIALLTEQDKAGEYVFNFRQTYTSKLMPAIDEILKSASLNARDLTGISVSSGPGSFTGLRIGVATAKGLAQGLDIPVVGIPTLDGLAFNLFPCRDLICTILDARREELYCTFYRAGQRLGEYMVCPPPTLLKTIKSKVIFVGDGIETYGDLIKKKLGQKAVFAPEEKRLPTALSIAKLGLRALERKKDGELLTLKPIYIRPSDAEVTFQEARKRRTKRI